ncbi:MAG: hypothetical protein ACREFB_07080, partial [Stellaceae bacterium]
GVTRDENLNNWTGALALNYYLSFFADQRTLHFQDMINYGAAFDMVAAALNRFSPLGMYETRHLLNALVGVLGLFGTWKLGRALGGPRTGFATALLLALKPTYYGQMLNNPKDIPFAVGGILYLTANRKPQSMIRTVTHAQPEIAAAAAPSRQRRTA